jgi:hypothetical protein
MVLAIFLGEGFFNGAFLEESIQFYNFQSDKWIMVGIEYMNEGKANDIEFQANGIEFQVENKQRPCLFRDVVDGICVRFCIRASVCLSVTDISKMELVVPPSTIDYPLDIKSNNSKITYLVPASLQSLSKYARLQVFPKMASWMRAKRERADEPHVSLVCIPLCHSLMACLVLIRF